MGELKPGHAEATLMGGGGEVRKEGGGGRAVVSGVDTGGGVEAADDTGRRRGVLVALPMKLVRKLRALPLKDAPPAAAAPAEYFGSRGSAYGSSLSVAWLLKGCSSCVGVEPPVS